MIGLLPDYKGDLILGNINTKDLLLHNVIYVREDRKNKTPDFLLVIIKNSRTGEKKLIKIDEPPMMMYVVKNEYRNYDYLPAFMPLAYCDQIKVKYNELIDRIVEVIGDKGREFADLCKKNNYRALRNIHKYPYILGTDYDMESLFRIEWMLHYHDSEAKRLISKCYLDIEVDTIDCEGFPTDGLYPINAISFVDDETKTAFEFILRNKKNPQIQELEDNLDKFIANCEETFNEQYPGFTYNIRFYDEEILMIYELFLLIHKLKRDFCGIWNMPFDIPYIIDRINVLGYEPKDIMCDPSFPAKILNYRKDIFHFDFKSKNDSFILSSFTVFMDQRALYSKTRKGQSELKSTKLDVIARKELGDAKIIFDGNSNIKTAAYDNFEQFILYSIKDSLLLYGIEDKTHDFDALFDYALVNGSQYSAVFSPTILLKNLAYISYYEQGYIIGNNRNVDYSKPRDPEAEKLLSEEDDKYAGALVGDPEYNDHIGVPIFGKNSKYVMGDVVDADFSAMYPHIIIAHNIGPESMIGKIVLDGFDHLDIKPEENMYESGKYFLEAIMSQDYEFIGKTYLNLPSVEDMYDEIMNLKG